MPTYTYRAKSFNGQEESGSLEAKSESQLAGLLKQEGLVLISAQEKGLAKKKRMEISLFSRVPITEKLMFARNLKVLISAGVVLPRSLDLLAQQTRSKKLSGTILAVKDRIIKGTSFSDALLGFPDVFSELFGSMIKVGEAGGKLEEVLGLLEKQMARQHEMSSKIKGALAYPAVIILAMLGIGAMMLLVVVPKLAETFETLQIELPPSTQFVIWLGQTMASRWYVVLLVLAVSLFLLARALKTEIGKKVLSFLSLKAPIISPIIKKANSAQTIRTLSSLITAGVPITRSLEILSESLGNFYYRKAMIVAAEEVRKGSNLSDALSSYSYIYSPLVIQMMAVGEETGQTAEILEKLADFYEEEVANVTKNLTSIIEPIIMLFIGAAVGFFAISMIQPMYSMLGSVQ